MSRSERLVFCVIVLNGALGLGTPTSVAGDVERPNIVLILADDVGREVLGCYGGTSYRTPRLDALAASGQRYTHAYTMPACHPTRTTLLTGQYPFQLGHPKWGSFPAVAQPRTVAQLLKKAGFATAVAGKWQLSLLKDNPDHPHELGFDEYCLFGWHEGPRYYRPHIWQNGRLREDVQDSYGPDVYCDAMIDFIKRNKQRPFFAFYSMALCHDVTDDLDTPVPLGPRGRYDSYAEMVAAMDQRVGRLVDALEQMGLRKRTLVLFFSDNGSPAETITTAVDDQLVRAPVVSALGEAMIPGGKTQLTDWGTRVPLIANWPTVIDSGTVSEALIDVSDFLPTLAELSGAALPTGVQLDGHSFASLLRNHDGGTREWVFAEHKGRSFVKDRRWKLYDDGRFFDIATDPDEKSPLAVDFLATDVARNYERLREQHPVDKPQ